MNWKGMHAWAKCKIAFGTGPKFASAMHTFAPGATLDSCSVTQSVLGMVINPGATLTPTEVRRDSLGAVSASDAVAKVSELLSGDKAVYLSVSPNHYFTILPLSSSEVALLQGFQGSYTLTQWMQAKSNGVMPKATFLMHFFLLFSGTTSVAVDAARALFAIPGTEGQIAHWFRNGNIRLTQLASASL